MLLHEIPGKPPYIPPEKKEKKYSEIKSKSTPIKMDIEGALNSVRRQLRRETIKQESLAEQGNKERAFIATDKTGGMIRVISASAPEEAVAKIFHQKFRGESEITREKPLEMCIRDLRSGTNSNIMIWTEISEDVDSADIGKAAVRHLVVRQLK